jgi:hypothetical protein
VHRAGQLQCRLVSAGYRASKVIGSNVLNDANETSERLKTCSSVPTARRHIPCYRSVVSSAWVVVPYDSLKLVDNKIVLPGGTKQTLKMLPEFKYSAK